MSMLSIWYWLLLPQKRTKVWPGPAPPPSYIFGDSNIQCAPFTHKALLQQQAEAAPLKSREPRLPFIGKKPANSGSSAAREMFYSSLGGNNLQVGG